MPINASYRIPAPGSVSPYDYDDPVTLPAGDVAGNPYWKRDNRRNYPQLSTVTQRDVVALLELGSRAAPRIEDGEKGARQLVEVSQGSLVLAEVLRRKAQAEAGGLAKEVLGENGMPPLPGKGMTWAMHTDGGFPPE